MGGEVSVIDKTRPLVSVVSPFYNPEPYFRQCVESVLAQTYTHFEYVLIDNMSTDGGAAAADEFARRDPRVRVVHNTKFLTQQQNHNEAMRHVSPDAKYVKVLQADDWLFPTCLEQMVALAEANPSVGLVSAYTLLERSVYLDGLPHPSACVPGRDICRRFLLEGLNVFGSPTASLIRADIVRSREPFYDEDSPIEDLEICFEILKNSDFGFVNQVLTFTRRDNISAMTVLKPFGMPILSHPMILEKFGAHYLTPEEIARRSREVYRDEYRTLAHGVLRRFPTAFWDLHRKCLGLVGRTIDKPRVAWTVLVLLLERLLNPQATLARLWRKTKAKAR